MKTLHILPDSVPDLELTSVSQNIHLRIDYKNNNSCKYESKRNSSKRKRRLM